MHFAYGSISTGRTTLSARLAVGISMCALPVLFWAGSHNTLSGHTVAVEQHLHPSAQTMDSAPPGKADPRVGRLTRFFAKLNCPVLNLSHVFVKAADENHLDWRLLPSISVVESGGGKAYRNNNIFGWDNGLQLFPSVSSGIEIVAAKLGRSPLYRNLDSVQKLRIYNPNESYVHEVVTVMNRIGPPPDLVRN